nr:MAG TPA: hypothetical protein [Caudoviricetes sp.]DAW72136.1 MAG TPA: hypothetical protein [Caudoviricetes sp.]
MFSCEIWVQKKPFETAWMWGILIRCERCCQYHHNEILSI